MRLYYEYQSAIKQNKVMIFTDTAEGHAWVSAASCYMKEAGCERPVLHEPKHVKVCVGGKQVGARRAGGERLA